MPPTRPGHRPAGPVVMALALVLAVPAFGTVARAAATPLYPDLAVLPPRDLQLDRTDVSVDGSGQYDNVLRFSNTVWNKGLGRLEMRSTIDPTTMTGRAIQRVYDDQGGYTDYDVGQFYYHPIHDHFHYEGWGLYQLWTKTDYDKWIASGRTQGQAKKVGTKTTSCVIDEEFTATLANTPWPAVYGAAGCKLDSQDRLLEGLSPGWGDTYDYYRYEQWIDLGQDTLTDGQWVLRSVADPNNQIYESPGKADAAAESASANEGITVFSVSGGRIVDSNPPSGTVSIDHVNGQTSTAQVTCQILGRDDVSGVQSFRLSNDGQTWATYPYAAPGPSTAQDVSWDLTDARYGGTPATGTKTVYAQFQDGVGNWSATVTDTIDLAAPTGYAAAVTADSPVSYWRLGEASGSAASDAMGRNSGTYENGPTLGRPALTAGDTTNSAVGFDGVNDDVLIPSSSSLNVSSGFSLEAWIRPTSLPAAGSFASVITKQEAYSIQFNGPLLEFTVIQSGTRRRLQAPGGTIVSGGTYHVVATYDGATQRLYVNGSQVASAALSGGASVTTYPLRIASWNGSKEFFPGTIDEVAVYASTLSAARVAAHWTAAGGAMTSGVTPQSSSTTQVAPGPSRQPRTTPSSSAGPAPTPTPSPSDASMP